MYIDVHDIPTKGSDSDNSKTLSELEDSIFHNSRVVNTKLRLADDLVLVVKENQHKRRRHSSNP